MPSRTPGPGATGHETTGEGQHLHLSATQVRPAMVDEFLENREGVKQPPHLGAQIFSIRGRVSTEEKFLLDRKT